MGGIKGDKWPYGGASQMATKFGHKMMTSSLVDDVVSDPDNRIVTTPAYMQANAKPHEVFDGISKFVSHVTHMVR